MFEVDSWEQSEMEKEELAEIQAEIDAHTLDRDEWLERHKRLTGRVIVTYHSKNYSDEKQNAYERAYEELVSFALTFRIRNPEDPEA